MKEREEDTEKESWYYQVWEMSRNKRKRRKRRGEQEKKEKKPLRGCPELIYDHSR